MSGTRRLIASGRVPRDFPLCTLCLVTAAVVLLGTSVRPVSAQFQQFTRPGSLTEPQVSTKQELETAIQSALWQAGALRIQPWVGLRDLSYNKNLLASEGEQDSDIVGSVGAGLRFYVPFGDNTFFSAHALPEYTFYVDQSERNRVNGRYGAGLFGYYNRLEWQLAATLEERLGVFSSEFEVLNNQGREQLYGALEVRLAGALWAFGTASSSTLEYLLDEDDPSLPPLDNNDREEEILQYGLRFRFSDDFKIGLGIEDSTTTFLEGGPNLDNSGTYPILLLDYDGPNLGFRASIAALDLVPAPGSLFVPLEEPAGSLSLSLNQSRRLGGSLYAFRNLVYSPGTVFAYYLNERTGVAISFGLHRRSNLQIYYEWGDDDYTAFAGLDTDRVDDATTLGGDISFDVGPVVLRLYARVTDYDSSIPNLSREVTYAGIGINLGTGPLSWP